MLESATMVLTNTDGKKVVFLVDKATYHVRSDYIGEVESNGKGEVVFWSTCMMPSDIIVSAAKLMKDIHDHLGVSEKIRGLIDVPAQEKETN